MQTVSEFGSIGKARLAAKDGPVTLVLADGRLRLYYPGTAGRFLADGLLSFLSPPSCRVDHPAGGREKILTGARKMIDSEKLHQKLAEARDKEAETGERFYVLISIDGPIVVDTMPLFGIWFDADGIRHG